MFASKNAKLWVSDPATWPIFAVIGGAVVLCVGASSRYLIKSPDVQWNKTDRAATIRDNVDEGIKWSTHKPSLAYLRPNAINTNPEIVQRSRTLSRRNTKEHFKTVGLAATL